jgi:hypothetical protein
LPYRQPCSKKKTITYRNIKAIDLSLWLSDLSKLDLCTNPSDDLDELVDQYCNSLGNLLDKHAPLKTKVIPIRFQAKWYNNDIATAKRNRRKAERLWRKTKLKSKS